MNQFTYQITFETDDSPGTISFDADEPLVVPREGEFVELNSDLYEVLKVTHRFLPQYSDGPLSIASILVQSMVRIRLVSHSSP